MKNTKKTKKKRILGLLKNLLVGVEFISSLLFNSILVLGLIKRLGGVEQLEKQLTAQEGSKAAIKPSLFSKVLSGRSGTKYRGAQQEETSTLK